MKNTYYLAISDTVCRIVNIHAYKMNFIAVRAVDKEGTQISCSLCYLQIMKCMGCLVSTPNSIGFYLHIICQVHLF